MAPPIKRQQRIGRIQYIQARIRNIQKLCVNIQTQYANINFLKRIIFDPSLIWVSAILLIIAEIFVNILVVQQVPYTEIDWTAYMQEVEGVVNGTWDYTQLKGDTGPLVYPAGFVYVFGILYYVTNFGQNIRRAQYIFVGFYILTLILVFRIYSKSHKIPPYALLFLCCTSYRVHSIYVLRLFNDPVAMIFLYAAINLFIDDYWTLGSIFYSFAVSVKMNILLFAPALLLAYIATQGIRGTIKQLSICASIQVILGAPFLLANPVGYILGAFNLGRVFLFEWTVNWRFLPEEVFTHQGFHILLLVVHLALLAVFAFPWFRFMKSFAKLKATKVTIVSQLFLLPLFTANFIGMALSRSLHYQFYVWYFHTLPYLLWSTPYSVVLRICILGVMEFCWNTFPSTSESSMALHVCHLMIICGLFLRRNPAKDLNLPIKKSSDQNKTK